MKLASALVVTLSFAAIVEAQAPALPDWSGAWQMIGPTVFDTATVEPKNGRGRRCRRARAPPVHGGVRSALLEEHRGNQQGTVPRSDHQLRRAARHAARAERAGRVRVRRH